MTTESFGETSQEMYGYIPSYQDRTERPSPVKEHALTCLSTLNLDDETVGMQGSPVNKKTERRFESTRLTTLCSCSKTLPQGSCKDGTNLPLPLQKSPGDQMDVTGGEGLNDTPLLAPVLMLTPESDTPPLARSKTGGSKKWLLQEDGSYVPIFVEESGHPSVSSMIPLLNDKPVESRPGVTQTWGIITTLIKQQEQLNVSQLHAADNSKDATSAFTSSEEITMTIDPKDQDLMIL